MNGDDDDVLNHVLEESGFADQYGALLSSIPRLEDWKAGLIFLLSRDPFPQGSVAVGEFRTLRTPVSFGNFPAIRVRYHYEEGTQTIRLYNMMAVDRVVPGFLEESF